MPRIPTLFELSAIAVQRYYDSDHIENLIKNREITEAAHEILKKKDWKYLCSIPQDFKMIIALSPPESIFRMFFRRIKVKPSQISNPALNLLKIFSRNERSKIKNFKNFVIHCAIYERDDIISKLIDNDSIRFFVAGYIQNIPIKFNYLNILKKKINELNNKRGFPKILFTSRPIYISPRMIFRDIFI